MSRKLIVAILLGFCLTLPGLPLFYPSVASSVAGPSCTPNASNTLNIFAYGGVPSNFNQLEGAGSPAGVFVTGIEYPYSLYPFHSTNGYLDWNTSLSSAIASNANFTQWFFHIKSGVYWSNGQEITPQDIVDNYGSNWALNPNYDFQFLGKEITSVNVYNSSTVEFVLNKSDAQLPEELSAQLYVPIYPPSFIDQGPTFNGFGTTVADGPFYLHDYTSGSPTAVLMRNPYFNPLPNICDVVVQFGETTSQAPAYLEGGTVDLATVVNTVVPSLTNSSYPNLHVNLVSNALSTLLWFYYNYPYNMTAFRQALVYGIDQSTIVQNAYAGEGITAYNAEGGIPSGGYGYSPNQTTYSYNPTRAISLLNSIGITKGSDGYLQYPNGTDITLNLYPVSVNSINVVAASSIKTNLESLGFKVNAIAETARTLIPDIIQNSNGVKDGIIIFTGNPLFGDTFVSSQPIWNVYIPFPARPNWEYPAIVDQQYNGLEAQLKATDNTATDLSLFQQIQNLNAQNIPAVMLAYGETPWIYSTAHWVGWGQSIAEHAYFFNTSMLATLKPASSASTSTSPETSTTSTLATTLISSTSGASTSTSSVSTSNTSTSSSISLVSSYLYVIAIVAAVLIAISVGFNLRKGRSLT